MSQMYPLGNIGPQTDHLNSLRPASSPDTPRARSASPSWWQVEDLHRDGVLVWISVRDTSIDEAGQACEVDQLLGLRKTFRRLREITWTVKLNGYPETRRARSHVVWSVKRADGQLQDLPPHALPQFWRPIDMRKWPDPLPEPYPLHAWRPPAPVPAELAEPATKGQTFEWRGPYSKPGDISEAEAEVRLIRGLRTHGAKALQGSQKIVVGAYRDSILLVARGDLPLEHRDETDSRVIPMKWEATGRDFGDEPIAMGWFTRLSAEQRNVVKRRAQIPPWSFRQIGEVLKGQPKWEHVREVYRAAIRDVVPIANEKCGSR